MYWATHIGFKDVREGDVIRLGNADFVFRNNILRQKDIYSKAQVQTKDVFHFKWDKKDTYESAVVKDSMRKWLFQKYFDGDEKHLQSLVKSGAKVLDAGCGCGFSILLFLDDLINKVHYLGVDISGAVDIARKQFEERGLRGEFLQADIMNLPFSTPTFDFIFSEGVLHHTDSTEQAIKKLAQFLLPEGKFLFLCIP